MAKEKKITFKSVDPKPNFSRQEEKILEFWKNKKIFPKSIANRKDNPDFIFYEGPPTANARPGIHHVITRVFKDLIIRYQTMRGKRVLRRAGWDTHGLPVELEVEKSLGLNSKSEIEQFGIARFNQLCRDSVWKYRKDWEKLTERIGFWLSLENPYITYENSYIEALWALIKEIYQKELLYQDYRVFPYCYRCGTLLSFHEVAQGYQDIEDIAIFVKFPLKDKKDEYFLIWTTTPWTLPGNIALAVGEKIEYVQIAIQDEKLILARDRLKAIKSKYQVIKSLTGKDLTGLKYDPLYEVKEFITKPGKDDYSVVAAPFVSTEEGTGIVHIAPAFGEEDMELRKKFDLAIPITINEEGVMMFEIGKGKSVKQADREILSDLERRHLLFKEEKIVHTYPFCWRCDNPLIYYVKEAWLIRMSSLRVQLIESNQKINWLPENLKEGRFGQWLKENRDWNFSRERYWGTPLPIWRCGKCQQVIVIGSVNELKEKATKPLPKDLDLHRPQVDQIKLNCPCGGEAQRVKDLIDVWFDSGAMPFASGEYPHRYPADFICEALDQTRGWFYTLLAIATTKSLPSPYKTCLTTGLVLDEKGKKMSKSKGNTIDLWEIADGVGVDALRWYFYTINQPGENKLFVMKDLIQTQRKFQLILWNIYNFFITYVRLNHFQPSDQWPKKNLLDQWILALLQNLISQVTDNLDHYEVTKAARQIEQFIDELSTWYLRRSRKRKDQDFYQTLYQVLINLTKLIAPFAPFLSEELWQNLFQEAESVHLTDWPIINQQLVDRDLILKMTKGRQIAELAHQLRAKAKIKLRQPLEKIELNYKLDGLELNQILIDELNIKKIVIVKKISHQLLQTEGYGIKVGLATQITPELLEEGLIREIIRFGQELRRKAGFSYEQKINFYWQSSGKIAQLFKKNGSIIKKEILAQQIINNRESQSDAQGDFLLEEKPLWLGVKKISRSNG